MNLLIVIDMQNDFITGALGNAETKAVVPKVCELINKNLKENDYKKIICTYDTHEENYLDTQEGKKLPVPHCIANTNGWRLDPAVQAAVCGYEVPILKDTFGGIFLPDEVKKLEMRLRLNSDKPEKIDTITLCGVCTDICVISNAMLLKAFFPEKNIQVAADCCAGVTPESHERALEAMKMCQIDIV